MTSSLSVKVALGGTVVACVTLDTTFAVSLPAEGNGFLRVIQTRNTSSFGGEVQPLVVCLKILWYVKGPYEYYRDTL
jgi:hypothetical protein